MTTPLSAKAVASTVERLLGQSPTRLAVAVSGGADSMALLHLIEAAYPGGVTALTVNHQLRPEATDEAAFVGGVCAGLAVPHHTLNWDDGPVAQTSSGNLQAKARAARYDLMAAWCRAHGVDVILTAHQASDQAETVLLNLARGSGVDGLAAMPELRDLGEVRLVRPLLAYSKRTLEQYCRDHCVEWVNDPSNEDDAYDRIRLRNTLPQFEQAGLDQDSLVQTAAHMARVKDALDSYTADYMCHHVDIDCLGGVAIALGPLRDRPLEIQMRVLGRVLKAAGGRAHRPDAGQLEALLDRFVGAAKGKRTLGGTVITWAAGRATIRREARHLPKDQRIGTQGTLCWDNRAQWHMKQPSDGLFLRGLDLAHWSDVHASSEEIVFPAELRPTIPALYDLEGPVAVPVLGYWRDPSAEALIKCNWSPLAQKLGLRTDR